MPAKTEIHIGTSFPIQNGEQVRHIFPLSFQKKQDALDDAVKSAETDSFGMLVFPLPNTESNDVQRFVIVVGNGDGAKLYYAAADKQARITGMPGRESSLTEVFSYENNGHYISPSSQSEPHRHLASFVRYEINPFVRLIDGMVEYPLTLSPHGDILRIVAHNIPGAARRIKAQFEAFPQRPPYTVLSASEADNWRAIETSPRQAVRSLSGFTFPRR